MTRSRKPPAHGYGGGRLLLRRKVTECSWWRQRRARLIWIEMALRADWHHGTTRVYLRTFGEWLAVHPSTIRRGLDDLASAGAITKQPLGYRGIRITLTDYARLCQPDTGQGTYLWIDRRAIWQRPGWANMDTRPVMLALALACHADFEPFPVPRRGGDVILHRGDWVGSITELADLAAVTEKECNRSVRRLKRRSEIEIVARSRLQGTHFRLCQPGDFLWSPETGKLNIQPEGEHGPEHGPDHEPDTQYKKNNEGQDQHLWESDLYVYESAPDGHQSIISTHRTGQANPLTGEMVSDSERHAGARPPWYPGEPFWARLSDWAREDWHKNYEERAGIMEYDGGLSRQQAESEAYALVLRQFQRERR